MRIISNKKNYTVLARSGEIQRAQNARGVLEDIIIQSSITLEFRHGYQTPAETLFAMRHWNKGKQRDLTDPFGYEAWGAHAETHAQPYDNGTERGVTVAWSPQMNLSVFDTEWILVAEEREYVENWILSGKFDSGGDAIVYEAPALVAPWPTYDSIGQGAAVKIPAMVRDLGLSPVAVIEYEVAKKNREGVIAGLSKLLQADAADAAVDASLEVVL